MISPDFALYTDMGLNSVDRRREPRFLVASNAQVIGGKRPAQAGIIVDVSDHGLGLSVSQAPCKKGEILRVCVDRAVITGRLMYCRRTGSEYTAGVELKDRLNEGQVRALLAEFARS